MRNTIAYPTQQSSSPSRGISCSHKRGNDESQRYNCFTRNGGNAIPKHAGPEAKGSNPTTGLNPLRANFNHWQVSRKEGQIFFKRRCIVIKSHSSDPRSELAFIRERD